MLVRPFVIALTSLPLLTTTLVVCEVEACSPPYGFTIEHVYPEADAADVPIDGVIALVGWGYTSDAPQVSVMLGAVPVVGEVTQPHGDRYVWRSAVPLEPDTMYTVHVETDAMSDVDVDIIDFQFTTGSAPAPALTAPMLASAVAEGVEVDLKECIEPGDEGDCEDCYEYKVTGVEQRMRLIAEVTAPAGPFVGFHIGRLAYGSDPGNLDLSATQSEPAGGGAVVHTIDLGIAGSWPSEQVCMRPELQGPVGPEVQGEISCIDISEINQPPIVAPTTGDSVDTGNSESAGESESSDDDSEGPDHLGGKGKGCGCRSDGEACSSGLLVLLGLTRLRRRRL